MFIVDLYNSKEYDCVYTGNKAYNLSAVYGQGYNVPSGFCVTTEAFSMFLKEIGISEYVKEIYDDIEKVTDEMLHSVRIAILESPMPQCLKALIGRAVSQLQMDSNIYFACRSSSVDEDLVGMSFAGQYYTALNLKNLDEILAAVKDCWASAFSLNVLNYIRRIGYKDIKCMMAVLIQKMVNVHIAGVAFSKNPADCSDTIVIETAYGTGDIVVSGEAETECYFLDRFSGEITKRDYDQSTSILSVENITELKQVILNLEEFFKMDVDIEFAFGHLYEHEEDILYILQCRAMTGGKEINEIHDNDTSEKIFNHLIASGLGVSGGKHKGKAFHLISGRERKLFQKGDIIITRQLTIDLYPLMYIAGAVLVSDKSLVSHACTVTRELGIPCIIGVDNLSAIIHGKEYIVDGTNGFIYSSNEQNIWKKLAYSEKNTGESVFSFMTANLIGKKHTSQYPHFEVFDIAYYIQNMMSINHNMDFVLDFSKYFEENCYILKSRSARIIRCWVPNDTALKLFHLKKETRKTLIDEQIAFYANCESIQAILLPVSFDDKIFFKKYADMKKVYFDFSASITWKWEEFSDKRVCINYKQYESVKNDLRKRNPNADIVIICNDTRTAHSLRHLIDLGISVIVSNAYELIYK